MRKRRYKQSMTSDKPNDTAIELMRKQDCYFTGDASTELFIRKAIKENNLQGRFVRIKSLKDFEKEEGVPHYIVPTELAPMVPLNYYPHIIISHGRVVGVVWTTSEGKK